MKGVLLFRRQRGNMLTDGTLDHGCVCPLDWVHDGLAALRENDKEGGKMVLSEQPCVV